MCFVLASLANYWKFDSNLNDIVGSCNLFPSASFSFSSDRYEIDNSSISLNNSYLIAPAGVYFSGDFSITLWLYMESTITFSNWEVTVLNFGNKFGKPSDNVIFKIQNGSLKGIVNQGYFSSSSISVNSSLIQFDVWFHLAFVVENSIGYLYLDGNQLTNGRMFQPNNVVRNLNLIGQSANFSINMNDLKIFQGGLQPAEVKSDYIGKIFKIIINLVIFY